jgi:putative transcriptional regulator
VIYLVKNRLKEILEERGIKQTWLAEQVGVTRQTMSNLINNRFCPSLDIAFKIANVLGLKLDDVFYYE